jgi:hypothetical protein
MVRRDTDLVFVGLALRRQGCAGALAVVRHFRRSALATIEWTSIRIGMAGVIAMNIFRSDWAAIAIKPR